MNEAAKKHADSRVEFANHDDSVASFEAGVEWAFAQFKELGKECYVEAYSFELEYPSTPWSRLLFKVAKALGGDK